MKLPRRQFLHLAAGAAVLPAVSRVAFAETYPSRPVHLFVGFPPGGPGDIIARLMGQWLSERLGQQFIIENRPGAASNVGTEAVVRATPDGYTLLLATSSNAINATLYDTLNFNFIHDIVPVAGISSEPCVMEVNPSFPAKTVPEFIAYAKANPGKINMASAGNGSVPHVAGELFKTMTGVDMIHVPYRGARTCTHRSARRPGTSDVRSHCFLNRAHQGRSAARAGGDGATRSEELPDIPTVAEFVPGYEASAWQGIGAPKGTPADIVDKLNKRSTPGWPTPT